MIDGAGARHAEVRLADAAARGVPDAVAEIDLLCDQVLGRAARRLAHVPEDARDLLQEAKAHIVHPDVLGAYRGRGPLAGFLRVTGMRAMLIAERRADRRGWRERVAYGAEALPLAAHDPGFAAVDDRVDPGLRAAVERLPARARQVVVAIAVLGLTYRETADALDLPSGTVSSTYTRALATLRDNLVAHPAATRNAR
jgi:RNA polymerase sigma-70 factor (ECF subfamily)